MSMQELIRLQKIERQVVKILDECEKEGVFLGGGKRLDKPMTRASQEGPLVKELRRLIETKGAYTE